MSRKKEVILKNGRYAGKYLSDETCKRLEVLLKLSKEKGCVEDLKTCIFDLPPSVVSLIKESRSNEFADINVHRGKLENHQTLGVAYMYFAERLILGDSVGMGKTVEVAGLCNLLESERSKQGLPFKFLMLTGKTLIPEIRDKMIKFTGNYVEAVYGEKKYVENFVKENSAEIQYSVVGAHSLIKNALFQQYMMDYDENYGVNPFDVLIIDESGDVLTNESTQQYKDAVELAEYFDRIILLNATSFEKELRQFYAQLSFVDNTLLPTKTAFSKEYEVMQYGIKPYPVFSGKYKNADKFRNLVSYRYFARTRKSTGAKMEDCSADVFVSELSLEQKALLKVCSMPQMVYDCPSYFNSVGYNYATSVETTPKLRDLVGLVGGKLKNEPSILVYTRYREAQAAIANELKGMGFTVGVLNGSASIKARTDITNSFKLGDIQILVTNVQKGLDFGNCNHCIFYDYDPSSSKMVQFEGRMTREHDIVGKHVYLLVSEGKELKSLKEVVADRAQASDLFAGSDYSCVLSLLLDDERIKSL